MIDLVEQDLKDLKRRVDEYGRKQLCRELEDAGVALDYNTLTQKLNGFRRFTADEESAVLKIVGQK